MFAAVAAVALSGCGSFAPQRYASIESTAAAIQRTGAKSVAIASVTRSANFMPLCRTNFFIEAPEGQTFEEYVRRALQIELRAAGAAAAGPPQVTLRGDVSELEFSASTNITGGRWVIKLELTSSNGKEASFIESFEFDAGFMGHAACRRTAEAFLPAVENLVAKIASSPSFRTLLLP